MAPIRFISSDPASPSEWRKEARSSALLKRLRARVFVFSCLFGVVGHVYTDTITRIPHAGQNVQMKGA
jgi:hypothetical protein